MWIDDNIITRCDQRLVVDIWYPDHILVVLGRSNQVHEECYEDLCQQDRVPIMKRYGGGGTVVLYPGSLVVGIGAWVKEPFANDRYFRAINDCVIDTISAACNGAIEFSQRGISDICHEQRKCAGTSLFRSRNYLLYQASILVETGLSSIQKYLRHPSKEPAYREKRHHGDFLCFLSEVHPALARENLLSVFQNQFVGIVNEKLAGEFIDPISEQIVHVKNKILRG